jgi:hypothetical protein
MNATPPSWKSAGTPAELTTAFRQLVSAWKEKSGYLSNTVQMSVISEYQRIIGLGPAALPLILEELRRETDHWFWALEAISGEDPIPPEDRGYVQKMADAWIAWGRREGLIR